MFVSIFFSSDTKNFEEPLDEDVDDLFEKIVSYMQIVDKTTIDLVPKAITLYIIKRVETFINIDLSVEIGDYFDENIVSFYGNLKNKIVYIHFHLPFLYTG